MSTNVLLVEVKFSIFRKMMLARVVEAGAGVSVCFCYWMLFWVDLGVRKEEQ